MRLRSTLVLSTVAVALAATSSPAAAALKAPRPTSPAATANVQFVPAFSWNAVKGAVKYEFQLAADSKFAAPVEHGVFQTMNRHATVEKALPDGTYYWRVRGIDSRDRAGRWSSARRIVKAWTQRPVLTSPAQGATVTYPTTPLVLQWTPVAHAYKYRVTITTDPSLSSPVVRGLPVETSATSFALPISLADGNTYYWAVTPEDGEKHRGASSATGLFRWSWPSTIAGARVQDPRTMNDATTVFAPLLSWNGVTGAARYQVEVNTSQSFASGSKVCCDDPVIGTSLSPTDILPNVSFHAVGFFWRVRALDVDDHVGPWTQGPSFQEVFDPAVPSIPDLRLTDNTYEANGSPHVLTAGSATGAPVIRWSPVTGASSYEVQMGPLEAQGCDYSPALTRHAWDVRTATTAFTPLAFSRTLTTPAGAAYSGQVGADSKELLPGKWCVKVRARSDRDAKNGDVVSDWTQIGDDTTGAFDYQPIDPGTMRSPFHAVAGDYHGVGQVDRMPVLTWTPIPGATSYWVIVARDQALTDVIDVALTNVPAYAPRHGSLSVNTYPDQSNSFYWAVVPALNENGSGTAGSDTDDAPQPFQKSSVPPVQLAPANGSTLSGPPTFRWTPATGARNYCVQVALDNDFHDLVPQVVGVSPSCPSGAVTDSTAYTSASTYPSNTQLFWRVQALDETGRGLNWSSTGTFTRALGTPTANPTNPQAGDGIPVLQWSSVAGATSYSIHVDQVDGTTRDFTASSTAFTATGFYGSGVWRWQVRANFPKAPTGETPGAYTTLYPFARRIAPPPNAVGSRRSGALLISWDPSPVTIKQYRVQVSTSSSFTRVLESATVDGTAWAPKLTSQVYRAGGTLYWRVASIDEGLNVGGFASGSFTLKKGLHVTVSGAARRHTTSKLTVKVTDAAGHAVKGARVSGKGAGARVRAKKTGRSGMVTVRVRARKRGTIVIKVSRSGYASSTARVKVS